MAGPKMVDYSQFTPHPSSPEIDVQNILKIFCKKGKKILKKLLCYCFVAPGQLNRESEKQSQGPHNYGKEK